MHEIAMRTAVAGDGSFLEEMLVEAANAPNGTRTLAEALADPVIARYVNGWPRDTDVGLVALDGDEARVGAAWLRFFPEAAPGYGFVSADIPELAIGVVGGQRGRGVGRALLRTLARAAHDRGVERISLSVDRANPAAELYRAEGYRVVESRDEADTMLLDLRDV